MQVTRSEHRKLGRQPKFTGPGGFTVQAISIDGVAQYKVTRQGMLAGYARDVRELSRYVDLATLVMQDSAS